MKQLIPKEYEKVFVDLEKFAVVDINPKNIENFLKFTKN